MYSYPNEFLHSSPEALHTSSGVRETSASEGRNYTWNLASNHSCNLLGSFTCRNAGTWDRFFYFPSGERHAEDFYARKIQRLRPGLNPQTWVPEASMLSSRPPKPLSRIDSAIQNYINTQASHHDAVHGREVKTPHILSSGL